MRLSIVLFLLLTVSVSNVTLALGESTSHALWTTSLEPYSYALRPSPRYVGGRSYIGGKTADAGLLFSSADTILIYYLTKSRPSNLEKRSELNSSDPFSLVLVAFNAGSGAFEYKEHLPGRSGQASVLINADGQFLIRTGTIIRLYNDRFKLIKEKILATSIDGDHDHWSVQASPSGKALLVDHYSPNRSTDDVLDSSTLESVRAWTNDPLFPIFSVSDKEVVKPDSSGRGIWIRSFDGPWYKVSVGKCSSNPIALGNGEILNACGDQLTLFTSGAEILMEMSIEKNQHFENVVSATPNGRFIAVSAMATKGGFLDYTTVKRGSTAILVYDTALQRCIQRIRLDKLPKWDYHIALAPDGSRLAVMIDELLQVYSVQTNGCTQ